MKKYLFHRNISGVFFLFVSLFCNAQNKTTVKASVDTNKILLGERFSLTLQSTQSVKENLGFFTIDSIPHFEIVSKGKIDTSRTDNRIVLRQIIQLTSFDSGHRHIPSFYFDKRARTDSIPIDVIFSDFDPKQPYHDIKDIIEVNGQRKNNWWLYVVIGAVVLTVPVVYFLKRKKKPTQILIKTIDPYQEAMIQLKKLQSQNVSTQQFYTELVNIFRLFRKKGIHSLQKTTDDLILQLRSLNMNKEQFEKLTEALRLSDAVKFAKYIPEHSDNIMVLDTIKSTVQAIEQIK
jgi:hypothetical protein